MKSNKGHLDNSTLKPSVERVDNGVARFPVGGSKDAVYQFLRDNGFQMSDWSDKHWQRHDGAQLHLYGSGSMARISRGRDKPIIDADLATAMAQLKLKP